MLLQVALSKFKWECFQYNDEQEWTQHRTLVNTNIYKKLLTEFIIDSNLDFCILHFQVYESYIQIFGLARYFSCISHMMKIASPIPAPGIGPSCILSIFFRSLLHFSMRGSVTFSPSNMFIQLHSIVIAMFIYTSLFSLFTLYLHFTFYTNYTFVAVIMSCHSSLAVPCSL